MSPREHRSVEDKRQITAIFVISQWFFSDATYLYRRVSEMSEISEIFQKHMRLH